MKLIKLLPIAAVAFLAVSCQNEGGSLSSTSSQTDSLMYYLGQMNAGDYLREAQRDTLMKETSQKEAYIAGVKAGLSALQEGNDTYNKGVMMGMQMANNIIRFGEEMGVQLNKNQYTGSLKAALMADSMPNSQMAQAEFRRIMTDIDNAKKEKDKVAAQETLAQAAKTADLPKINDDLYGKVTESTDGETLKKDDEVSVEVKFTKEDGEAVRMPVSPSGKVGNSRSFPTVVSDAIETLKSGETGEFMTSAHALTNARVQQLGLQSSDIVKFTVKATLVPAEESKDKK